MHIACIRRKPVFFFLLHTSKMSHGSINTCNICIVLFSSILKSKARTSIIWQPSPCLYVISIASMPPLPFRSIIGFGVTEVRRIQVLWAYNSYPAIYLYYQYVCTYFTPTRVRLIVYNFFFFLFWNFADSEQVFTTHIFLCCIHIRICIPRRYMYRLLIYVIVRAV